MRTWQCTATGKRQNVTVGPHTFSVRPSTMYGHSSSLLLVSSITKFGIKLCSMFRRIILCDVPIRRFSAFNGLNIFNALSCPFNLCTGRYPSQIDSGSTNGSQGSLCHMMGCRFTASLCAYRGHARPIGAMFNG